MAHLYQEGKTNGNGHTAAAYEVTEKATTAKYEVSGEYLAKAKLSDRQRLDLAVDLFLGIAVNMKPTRRAIARDMGIPILELRHAIRRRMAKKRAAPVEPVVPKARDLSGWDPQSWLNRLPAAEREAFLAAAIDQL